MAEKSSPLILKIIEVIFLPLVIAVVGWKLQATLADNSVKLSYVQLAVEVLREPAGDTNRPLRSWAVEVFRKNSEIPVSSELAEELRDGRISLAANAQGSGVAVGALAPTGTASGDLK
ncbi:MAG: hypothetical protein ABUS47_02640 [Steroidobacter sp.]